LHEVYLTFCFLRISCFDFFVDSFRRCH
jgi:hypothetical protein